jgi:hypothetical protein
MVGEALAVRSTSHVVAYLIRARTLAGVGLALMAALFLVLAQGFQSRTAAAQSSQAHVVAWPGGNCLEGHLWPSRVQVDVELKDQDGNPVYSTTAETNSSGSFVVRPEGQPYVSCDIPVPLRPDMTYIASDGSTTKSLLIEPLSFDSLDPQTQIAMGTAATGRADPRVQISIYWNDNSQNAYFYWPIGADGNWSANVADNDGRVEPGSQGDVFAADNGADGNFDFTKATTWVTAVSLEASPADAALPAIAQAARLRVPAGTRVRLTGRLFAGAAKTCVKRKRVRLLKVTSKRSRVLESTRTSKNGRYSFLRKVRRTTRFRVRYRGSRLCQPSKSRVTTVRAAS